MPLFASCGCECDETVSVIYSGESCDAIEGFQPCVTYAEYCPPCAERAKLWPEYLADEETADAWFDEAVEAHRQKRLARDRERGRR